MTELKICIFDQIGNINVFENFSASVCPAAKGYRDHNHAQMTGGPGNGPY